MATAEHIEAVTTVTVPESYTLNLSPDEAEALYALTCNVTSDTFAGRFLVNIGMALNDAGVRNADDFKVTAREGYANLTAVTIRKTGRDEF